MNPDRVILIANYAPDRQWSMLRFHAMLETGLRDSGIPVLSWRPAPVHPDHSPPPWSLRGYFDKYLRFPRQVRSHLRKLPAGEKTLFHLCDHSNAVYHPLIRHRPCLVTCHDMLAIFAAEGRFPSARPGLLGRLQQRWIRRRLAGIPYVAAVSQSTRHDLIESGLASSDACRVIYPGLDFDPSNPLPGEDDAIPRHLGLPPDTPFLLHVGSNAFYKNRDGLLRIFDDVFRRYPDLPHHAVIVGDPFSPAQSAFLNKAPWENRLHLVPHLPETTLATLYARATAFLFPSLHEGFGWPPLEAQALGCPVLAANRDPLPEILRHSACLLDPDTPTAWADALAALHSNPEEAARRRTAGRANAATFSRDAMIEGYLRFYRDILAAGR